MTAPLTSLPKSLAWRAIVNTSIHARKVRASFSSWLVLALVCAASVGCSKEAQFKSVQFGAFTRDGDKLIFQAQTQLSKAKEPLIGWTFDVEGSPQAITIREVISGPPGAVWQPSDAVELTDEGRTVSVTAEVRNPGPAHFFHHWTLDRTDVAGNYKAALYIDGKLIKAVDFVLTD